MEPTEIVLEAISIGLKKGIEKITGDKASDLFQAMLAKIKARLRKNLSSAKASEAEQILLASADQTDREKLSNLLAASDVYEDQDIIQDARNLLAQFSTQNQHGDNISVNQNIKDSTVSGDVIGVQNVR